ncbi:MAG: permease [Candidatus Verstraetearchaeota archaeon]|nr:permease [Candidatus Verstraetearchaeota archaeon]
MLEDQLIGAGYWFAYISLELSVLFLGVSFLIGLITAYIPPNKVEHILSKYGKGLFGNVLGSVFGGVLPFCSCSTIPALIGLINIGIPFRIAMSFLIASPLGVFNLAVISLFSVMFGPKIALLYIVFTFFGAIFAGWLLDKFGLKLYLKKVRIVGGHDEIEINTSEIGKRWKKLKQKMRSSWFFTKSLYFRMVPYILIGVGIGAFIYGFVPEDLLAIYAGSSNPFAVPVAAAIGIPMYVRTETMIPICYVLTEKGVGIGTIMALIIGGAGASIPELTLLASIFKRKLLIAYVASIFTIATLTGYIFNFLVPSLIA